VPVVNVMQKYSSMEQVLPEVEELLKSLKAATQLK
jgi:hypothetical protein